MEVVEFAASSSSSTVSRPTFKGPDVFVSFSGEDVRRTFLSHLFGALAKEKITFFNDQDDLKIGDNIPEGLFKAIEQSKIAIVIFSRTYAFSSWCLRELRHIIRYKRNTERILPVFYEVDPSHVRKQQGDYAAAFSEHKKNKRTGDEITEWKQALRLATDISGRHFSQHSRSEAELVGQIIKAVLRKLNRSSSNDDLNNLVGIRGRIGAIGQLLCDGPLEERIIGIWGAGGIGKTTLARVVFDRFSNQFESCCFLRNVSEGLKKHGFSTLQAMLFAGLLKKDGVTIGTPFLPSDSGKKRLQNTKVLVVLDDITTSDQFDKILLRSFISRFGNGSRIVVTTRDPKVLESIKDSEKYEVKPLNRRHALELFHSYAFDKGSDTTKYAAFSIKVHHYARGIPLALKVYGSYLYSTRESERDDELKRIRNRKLEDHLFQISYEGLNIESKEIFLDIAAFFKGEDRCLVESVLNGPELSANKGVKDLIDRSLLIITQHDKLWMDNLVQQMGQEIVRQKWRKKLGKRGRLWEAEEICKVLATDTEREAVRGMFLDVMEIEDQLDLKPDVFSKMCNLRFLKIYNSGNMNQSKVFLSQGLESLPKSLVYFHWHGYPLNCLPSDFTPENLVELGMPYSKVEKLWNEDQNLGNLKIIDLSYSEKLTQIPDLSSASNVESINLEHCTSLCQVLLNQNLINLTSLNLNGCSSLQKISGCSSLQKSSSCSSLQNISSCSSLQKSSSCPSLQNISSCSSLQNISTLPGNITYLNIKNCSGLQSIPAEICELNSLCSLNLSGCSSLKGFPEIPRPMEYLMELILDRTAIENLPSSIDMLIALRTLSMDMCENLKALPDNISCLDSLQSLSIRCCPKLEHLPALPSSLPSVDARDCMSLKIVSRSKAVTEGCNCSHPINGATFIFYNCPNLDLDAQNNIAEDAQHRIRHMANGGDPYMTEICWPGNEISNWFENPLDGSSTMITLRSNQLDDTFLGFIFCVVVDFKDCNLDGDFKINCEVNCALPDAFAAHTWTWHWNHDHHSDNDRDMSHTMENGTAERACRSINSPHVFLFYDNGRQIHSNLRARRDTDSSSLAYEQNVSVTFKFHSIDSEGHVNSSNSQVKSCGIRLLHARDIRNLGCLSQDDEESSVEDGEISTVVEIVETRVQEVVEQNQQLLVNEQNQFQIIEPHPVENGEGSCCLELYSQLLEFCDRSGARSSGRQETSNLRVIPSQPMVVRELPSSGYKQVVEKLIKLENENREINEQLKYVIMMLQSSPNRQFNTQLQGISSGGSRNYRRF